MIISGDDSDYDILEEEHETISLNGTVWVKTQNSIWWGRLMQITFSNRKEDIKTLKIKGIYSQKEEIFSIRNVSI